MRGHAGVLIGLVGLALLATSGCSGASEPAAAAGSPTSSVTAVAVPAAADGANLAACADGVCEVRVNGPAPIPVGPGFQLTNVQVQSVTPDAVIIVANDAGGDFRVECSDNTCQTNATARTATQPPTLAARLSVGSELRFPAIAFKVVSIDDGVAVLRLRRP